MENKSILNPDPIDEKPSSKVLLSPDPDEFAWRTHPNTKNDCRGPENKRSQEREQLNSWFG
jgi:hypothetical protein